VDGDGKIELVVGENGWIKIFNGQGEIIKSFFTAQLLGILADIDDDGALEIFTFSNLSSRGLIAVWTHEGDMVQIFDTDLTPQRPGCAAVFPQAVLDIDGDGDLDLVVTKHSGYELQPRGVVAFDCESGEELWYYSIGPSPWRVACVELAESPKKQVLFAGLGPANNSKGSDGTVDIWPYSWCLAGSDGTLIWRNQYEGKGFMDSSIGVCDVEGDGELDVVATSFCHDWDPWGGTLGRVYLLDPLTGDILQERNFEMPVCLTALADLDQDGPTEIIVHVKNSQEQKSSVLALDSEFEIISSFDLPGCLFDWFQSVATDLDGDGTLELLVESKDLSSNIHKLLVLSSDLELLWELEPVPAGELFSFFVSDLDDDGALEIIATSRSGLSVYEGVAPPPPSIYMFVGDVNGDGVLNMADPISLLPNLFLGFYEWEPPCLAACDANGDEQVDIADVVALLAYLFAGGQLTGPDGFPIDRAEMGCRAWDRESVTLPCEFPCR